ncbi:acetate--CoA ligase [Reyranella sp.]|uniref:acetate--CoA ligase n=1 Tax=Reyranella sp. TaxID=1929291 RepID=UPI00272FBBE0|nr:acetate--CoA ligase [Reyranella sp.]MDP2374328.1 acetate--CoA ligase [Reyranella sp.]
MLPVIDKPHGSLRIVPNLMDYEALCSSFTWQAARKAFAGLPGGGLNMAHEAVGREVEQGRGQRVAIRHLGRDGSTTDLTFAALDKAANRFANVLESLGVAQGEAIFSLSGRIPGFYAAVLGTLKRGAVFCPLFSAFGPEPIRARLEIGHGVVLVTTRALFQRKIEGLLDKLPGLRFVLLIDGRQEDERDRVRALPALLEAAAEEYRTVATSADDPALMHFTSGTTGRPKGAVLAHESVVAHAVTARYALDLHDDDIFWCTADPGWVTGMSYGVIGPLVCGVTSIVDEMEFDADRWYSIIQQHKVTVWYTAPTAIRMLMKVGTEVARKYDLSSLRFLASVGEPLNPEAVVWSDQAFGRPFHDNWWQTETGGIMIANFAALPVKPGSMGKPLPGIEAAIVERTAGGVRAVDEPNVEGELALKAGWPSMFRGYLGEDERYRKCFVGDWYLTGDLARRDQDGYYWFVGRSDDVIKTAGHLVGPFEVESALMEHPAVAEAAVIGKPDEVAGNTIKAFVALKAGHQPGPELERDLMAHARRRLGPAVAPREIAFRDNLPKTRSGKIMRRLLRARELGLPEGDLSTLESDEK